MNTILYDNFILKLDDERKKKKEWLSAILLLFAEGGHSGIPALSILQTELKFCTFMYL